jgi:gluconate 2-dehydrogenase alpha chain
MSDADVLIIGLGGAGGIAADVLTRAGADVLALEAGERIATADSQFDEIANDLRARLSAPKALTEMPTWRFHPDVEAGRAPWPVLMVNAVGGSTVHYPGLSARFHPWNFESRTSTIARYGAGAVPADSTLADWPLSYEELEADYEAVERAIGVAGSAGNLDGSLTGEGSAFEGPRRSPYPMPPLRRTGWTALTDTAARSLARLASLSGARRDQLRSLQRQPRVLLLRLLHGQRLPPRRQGLDRRQRDPPRRADRTAHDRHRRPRDANRG